MIRRAVRKLQRTIDRRGLSRFRSSKRRVAFRGDGFSAVLNIARLAPDAATRRGRRCSRGRPHTATSRTWCRDARRRRRSRRPGDWPSYATIRRHSPQSTGLVREGTVDIESAAFAAPCRSPRTASESRERREKLGVHRNTRSIVSPACTPSSFAATSPITTYRSVGRRADGLPTGSSGRQNAPARPSRLATATIEPEGHPSGPKAR